MQKINQAPNSDGYSIIRMLSAFVHDSLGIIFMPLYDKSLFGLLRDENFWDYLEGDDKEMEATQTTLLIQMGKLASAIRHLHHIQVADSEETVNEDARPLFGSICHRDIKPGKILVRGKGEQLQLVLCDFEHAILYRENEQIPLGSDRTGDAGFQPPPPTAELISPKDYYEKYDVWSFGCTLFEVLTWILDGCKWRKLFDDARTTGLNQQLWGRSDQSTNRGSIEIKPQIRTFRANLQTSFGARQVGLRNALRLTFGMLRIDDTARLSITEVVQQWDAAMPLVKYAIPMQDLPEATGFVDLTSEEGSHAFTPTDETLHECPPFEDSIGPLKLSVNHEASKLLLRTLRWFGGCKSIC